MLTLRTWWIVSSMSAVMKLSHAAKIGCVIMVDSASASGILRSLARCSKNVSGNDAGPQACHIRLLFDACKAKE